MAAELETDLQDTVGQCIKWLVDFNVGKTQLVSFDWSYNTGVIDVKMDRFVFAFEEKSSFKTLAFSFSSKLNWDSQIFSIA